MVRNSLDWDRDQEQDPGTGSGFLDGSGFNEYGSEQCFGSIIIESGSGSSKNLNPEPDPSYFFTLSEKNLNYCTLGEIYCHPPIFIIEAQNLSLFNSE